jgi:hypothetical protein
MVGPAAQGAQVRGELTSGSIPTQGGGGGAPAATTSGARGATTPDTGSYRRAQGLRGSSGCGVERLHVRN